jgi:hypothetical protein
VAAEPAAEVIDTAAPEAPVPEVDPVDQGAEPAAEVIDTAAPEAPVPEVDPVDQGSEQPRRRPWRFVSPLDGVPLGRTPGVAANDGTPPRTRRLGPARKDIVQ